MYNGEITREDSVAIVNLWNERKPASVVKASPRDLYWLGGALDKAAEESDTPLSWLRSKIEEYLASEQAKTFPTTLKNFLCKGKFLEDAEIWNHGAKPKFDPIEQTRLKLAEPPPKNEATDWAKSISDEELEAAALRACEMFIFLRARVLLESGRIDIPKLRSSPLCLALAYGGKL